MYPLVEGRFAYNVELYYYGMKATQIVGTLFNLFTIFMIWKYSAIKMKEYRIHLLWYQVGILFSKAKLVRKGDKLGGFCSPESWLP